MMISKVEENRLINICRSWKTNSMVINNPILSKIYDIGLMENYSESILNEPPIVMDNITLEKNKNNISAMNTNISKLQSDLSNTDVTPDPNETFNNSYGCLFESGNGNLCSGMGNPTNLVAPIPGPQWMPQTAESVQNRLKNQDYTASTCPL